MVDLVLCEQRYFTPRPKAGLQAREYGTDKINRTTDLFSGLAVCDEHLAEKLELINILK